MSDGCGHPSDLPVFSLGQSDADPSVGDFFSNSYWRVSHGVFGSGIQYGCLAGKAAVAANNN